MVDTLRFKSSEFEAAEAFGAYHDLYAAGSTSGQLDDCAFAAEVTAFRYPRMLVYQRVLAGVSHERDHRRVARDGFDHINLHLICSGTLLVGVENGVIVASAGQIVCFDMRRPQRTWTENARLITIALARDAVARKISPFVDLHGRLLPAGHCGLLADFMASLVERGDEVNLRIASVATDTIAELLAGTLDDGHAINRAPKHRETAKIEQVLAYIDRYISDPGLTADKIALAVGVSRSVLYRLFEPLGGLASCIQQRRLTAIRRALSRIDEARPYKAIAESYGFINASHANRSFRQFFGMTPGDYRRQILTEDEIRSSDGSHADGFAAWLPELR